jgi:hypothetical protein
MMILLWAALPALATLFVSDMGLMMTLITIEGLLVTFIIALMLSSQFSWSQSLIGLVVLSCFSGLLLNWVDPETVQSVTDSLTKMLEQMRAQTEQTEVWEVPSPNFVVGLISYVIALNSLLSLLLARWWQSTLYNPNGFQAEFHQLRLGPVQTTVCIAAMALCWSQGGDYQTWASLMGLPLLLAGIALVHHTVKTRNAGGQWLVLFYLMLVLISPLTMALMLVAALDTWINFRARIAPKNQGS